MTTARTQLDRGALLTLGCGLLAITLLLTFAPDALAAGNDVGKNFGDLLKKYAGEVYVGIIAIVSIIFLLNRAYTQLGLFMVAAVAVGILVFSPGSIANLSKDTAHTLFK